MCTKHLFFKDFIANEKKLKHSKERKIEYHYFRTKKKYSIFFLRVSSRSFCSITIQLNIDRKTQITNVHIYWKHNDNNNREWNSFIRQTSQENIYHFLCIWLCSLNQTISSTIIIMYNDDDDDDSLSILFHVYIITHIKA